MAGASEKQSLILQVLPDTCEICAQILRRFQLSDARSDFRFVADAVFCSPAGKHLPAIPGRPSHTLGFVNTMWWPSAPYDADQTRSEAGASTRALVFSPQKRGQKTLTSALRR